MQREMDLSAWLRGGPWVFAAMVAITVVFALGVSSLRHGGDDEFVPLVVGDAVMTLVIIGVLRAAHRFATANVVGRRVAAVLVLSGLWVLAYDVFAWRMHWSVALASVAVVGSTRDPNARQGGASSLRILGVPSTSAQTRRAEEGSFAMLERRTALDSLSPHDY